ncbi:MAG: hypothetical protein O7E57_05420 [Gammaproteobacteria bacterium]|nr:hypothetical protein [Gammaproteobacteria bacterium]
MWFETLFSYPAYAYETGTFLFANVFQPLWWLIGSGLIAVAIAISVIAGVRTSSLVWWRQTVIAGLQIAVALGVIGLLAGPVLQTSTLQPGANNIAVLIDTSGSMSFPNVPGEGETRLNAAVELLQQQLAPGLSDLAEVAQFTFDTSAVRMTAQRVGSNNGPSAIQATEAETNLISSTASVLDSFKGAPLAAVIVLSDGADNGDNSIADMAALAAHGVPVHTIGFGPRSIRGEVQLADVQLAADAPPLSRVTASLVIEHTTNGEAVVHVRDGGTLLAVQRVQLSDSTPTVRTQIVFDSGSNGIRELNFELTPPPGDVLAENNQIQRLLTVNERRRRFLYLEGEPRWEYKFIRRAVAGDEVLELVSWLRTTDRKTYRQGVSNEDELADGFPPDLETLYGYDVIVLGSLAASSFTEEQHGWLESFVAERGGSLLVLAGRESLNDGGWDVMPLAAALPVVLKRASTPTYGSADGTVRPTREGLVSPLTQLTDNEGGDPWATLPHLGDYQRLGPLKPAATTLLELVQGTTVSPLLVTQPYGLGTTAILATATTWRWQMRTPPEDVRHSLFWRQLLRQLAETAQRPRNVSLTMDGGGIVVRVSVRNKLFEAAANVSANAVITHPDRSETRINLTPGDLPGTLAARYLPGAPGVYRVDVNINDPDGEETITRFVRTGVMNQEFFRPVQNELLLRRMAEATGGRYWSPDDVSGINAALTFAGSGVHVVKLLPLWYMPAVFILLMMLKLSEWWLRRAWGKV